MSELKVSVSGIRGIWGESLSLETAVDFAQAFAGYIGEQGGKRVLMGRDGRPTGDALARLVAGVLNSCGIDVVDAGLVPTPTVLFGVRHLNLDGGIIITASHNPIEWNALKFVKKGGIFTGEKDLASILSYLGKPGKLAHFARTGSYEKTNSVTDAHIEAVLQSVDLEAIQNADFRVILDPVNSAGCEITPRLLKALGATINVVNGEVDGTFHRGTEPTPANLTHLKEEVLSFQADAAFAQDPDADRLVLVDETGSVLSEEVTFAIAVMNLLTKDKGDIVANLSTSRMCDDLAGDAGVKCFRTKVGEANVVEGIIEHGALLGGEGNGGVIYPAVNTARDSLVGIALTLELMAKSGETLSQLRDRLPFYTMKKEKFEFSGDLAALYEKIRGAFPDASANDLDGLRMDFSGGWIHVRPSNTEPVVRVIGEAESETLLDAAIEKVKSLM